MKGARFVVLGAALVTGSIAAYAVTGDFASQAQAAIAGNSYILERTNAVDELSGANSFILLKGPTDAMLAAVHHGINGISK